MCAMRDKKGELLCGRRLATPALLDRGNAVAVVVVVAPMTRVPVELVDWGHLIIICSKVTQYKKEVESSGQKSEAKKCAKIGCF